MAVALQSSLPSSQISPPMASDAGAPRGGGGGESHRPEEAGRVVVADYFSQADGSTVCEIDLFSHAFA